MSHYGGCHITALMNVFPDVGLDVSKFSIRPCMYSSFKVETTHLPCFSSHPSIPYPPLTPFSSFVVRYWQSEANRRQFFMEFAERKAFDALVADYWYSITKKDLQDVKVLPPTPFGLVWFGLILFILPYFTLCYFTLLYH